MDHEHVWGPVERSKYAGTPHRKCLEPFCGEITLDLEDIDECDECDGSGRWTTTLEDAPTVLVDIGPCPKCGETNEPTSEG